MSHKPGGRLPLLSARPAVTPTTQFCCLVNRGTVGVNRLPKTVTLQRRGCNLNPGPTAPQSSTLTTRLPSHPSSCPANSGRALKEQSRLVNERAMIETQTCWKQERLVRCRCRRRRLTGRNGIRVTWDGDTDLPRIPSTNCCASSTKHEYRDSLVSCGDHFYSI